MMYNFLTIGHDCSPAAALRNLNLRNYALPFDWVVSNINTIDACFKDNFKKFHTNLRLSISQTRLIDEYGFEFPHDYPLDVDIDCSVEDLQLNEGKPINKDWIKYYPVVKDKYDRRIQRFLKIVSDTKPIIILCRYKTYDVLKLKEMFLKYYNKTNIYFVNSCNEQSYDKYIINCWTEKNTIWNETSLWKKALDDITYNLTYLDRMSSVTCVSGYWQITNKFSHDIYTKWFENTLRINCPYVFFGTKETIEIAKKYRRELPTYYIELELEDLYSYKYKDKMKIDPYHCPSVELNIIWNEKIFLIEKAKTLNIFNSEFFMWVDAGICSLRNEAPSTEKFPNLEKLSLLPTNKFIFTSSIYHIYEPEKLESYYHFISGTYLIHISMIDTLTTLYRVYLDKYLENTKIYTDQIILTYMYNDFPNVFHQLGHGYGKIITLLS